MKHQTKILPLLLLALGMIIFTHVDFAYAETKTVRILEGNIDPQCIETKCHDPKDVKIRTGETIVWINEDMPAHTIVSGSPYEGQDGIFDSGIILPDKTFEYTFTREGNYPYFCVLHPWATGTITVTGDAVPDDSETTEKPNEEEVITPEGTTETVKVKKLGTIGKNVGSGKSFTMSYISEGSLETSVVDMNGNSILFIFGKPASQGDEIILKIHKDMITNPTFVEVNGLDLQNYNFVKQGDFNTLMFRAPNEVWEIRVYGSQVVPEYGLAVMAIMGISVLGYVVFGRVSPIMRNYH